MPNDVRQVLFSGAGGGLVSWAFTLMTGSTFGLGPWLALPLCVILGTAAALVAVYVLTPTDPTKTARLIGFAVLCGFLWKPVLDAGKVMVHQRIDAAQQVKAAGSAVDAIRTAPAPAPEVVHQAADNAAELLRTSDRLDNAVVDSQATEKATEAVNAIAETSSANPEAAKVALQEIEKAAIDANNVDVRRLATSKLRALIVKQPERTGD